MIPDGVTSIGNKAFYDCSSLTSIVIPDAVTSIGAEAFGFCGSLRSVTIGRGVRSISYDAFPSRVSFQVDPENTAYTSQDGVLFNKDQTVLLQYPVEKPDTSYVIPGSVTSIYFNAFGGCTTLTDVTISESVVSIGTCAFSDCTALSNVTISNGVTSIGERAFANCAALTAVTIPASVTSISYKAFEDCPNLVIYGKRGSAAEEYARENKNFFVRQ